MRGIIDEQTPLQGNVRQRTFADGFEAGSLRGSVLVMLASIVGAGVVSIPYAVSRVGLLLGAGLMVLWAIVSCSTLVVLVDCSRLTGQYSYKSLALDTYGPWLSRMTDVTLACNLFGNCLAFIVAACNLFIHVVQAYAGDSAEGLLGNKLFLRVCVMLIVYPLCLFRNISSLRYCSLYTLFVMIYLIFATAWELMQRCGGGAGFNDEGEDSEGERPMPLGIGGGWLYCVASRAGEVPMAIWDWKGLLTAIPLVLFAFTCQQQMFPVYKELQRQSPRRMQKVLVRAVFPTAGLYFCIGSATVLTFGLDTPQNFLMGNYGQNPVIMGGVLMMSLSIVLGVPLNFFPFRAVMFEMMGVRRASGAVWVSFTTVALLVLLAIACSIDNIADVLGVLGATTNPLIVFIFPCLFWGRLLPRRADGGLDRRLQALIAVCVIAGGISVISLMSKLFPSWF